MAGIADGRLTDGRGRDRMIHYAIEKQGGEIWLRQKKYEPRFALKTESVFAQCNGYMGVRASLGLPSLDGKKGMFIAGLYNRAYEEEVTELVNCPDVTGYELVLDGVPVLPDSRCLTEFERKFNIHTGELVITSTYELESGASFCLTDRRFASMENEHLFVQSIGITMQKGCIKNGGICTGIDGQQTNSGVSHFKKVNCRVNDRKYLHVEGYLEEDTLSILEGVSYTGEEEEAVFTLKRRGITGRYFFSIPDGGTWEFTKYVYIQNEKDSLGLDRQKKLLEKCSEAGYADVFLKHKKIMQDIWRQARIEIDGASPEEEAAVSFAQYHLLGMMPWHSTDCSIAAKGLTGEGYKGHVFWDAEIFILPFFQYVFPQAARNLLEFRYKGLDGAREKAEAYGYKGAMYPWEAAVTGREETPLYAALNIHTGKANKVWSGIKEHHVTADIAYAVWQYYSVTGDRAFMERFGYEIIFETASFWVSRGQWDEKRQAYVICDIIGPDEYTEHVDNDAYTNYMARYCCRLASVLAEKLCAESPDLYRELNRRLGMDRNRKSWEEFADRLYVPVPNEELVIPQDDTFLSKKRIPDIEKYKKSQIKQAVLLDYSRDEVVDMQVLKQADVVMLLNLFPYMFSKEVVKKNVLFYEERTIHDSSLSYCAHAQACAAIGETELSWEFFKKCMVIDLDDNPNDTTDGIHAASLGGIWSCVIFGFAGISFSDGRLNVSPRLPKHWKEMRFSVKVYGHEIDVKINRREVLLESREKFVQPLSVLVNDEIYTLTDTLSVKCKDKEEDICA